MEGRGADDRDRGKRETEKGRLGWVGESGQRKLILKSQDDETGRY